MRLDQADTGTVKLRLQSSHGLATNHELKARVPHARPPGRRLNAFDGRFGATGGGDENCGCGQDAGT